MANATGAAIAGLIVGIIVVSQAGGSEGDGEGLTNSPPAVETSDRGSGSETVHDGDAEVPIAVEGGLATTVPDLRCPSVVCCGGHVR